ncbi:MAG: hypothetical protein IJF61_04185 [Clostridia bacterium]|nr:hypothetical protein [Clostridia bacterium]
MSKLAITKLYEQIYRRFDTLTPVPFDCGELCGKLCCQGDSESGMYLFPGEEQLFLNNPNFSVLPTDIVAGGRRVNLLVCDGPCTRTDRPLSCRIFPLVPMYRKGCTLEIIHDPRASICPLTHPEASGCIDPVFFREVEYAFRVLVKVPEVADFLEELSYILDDYQLL